jgi:hypothetical protein
MRSSDKGGGAQPLKPDEFPIRGLPSQFESQRGIGAAAFSSSRAPLELEPGVIAFEGFLQRCHGHTRQSCFDLSRKRALMAAVAADWRYQ